MLNNKQHLGEKNHTLSGSILNRVSISRMKLCGAVSLHYKILKPMKLDMILLFYPHDAILLFSTVFKWLMIYQKPLVMSPHYMSNKLLMSASTNFPTQ